MNSKVTGIVAYIGLVGWIIAFLAGDKEGAKFHLNQALVLNLISLVGGFVLGLIPLIGVILSLILSVVIFIFWILVLLQLLKKRKNPFH